MINLCILKTELRAACMVLNSLRGVGMGSLVGATRLLNDEYAELESRPCSGCLLFNFGLDGKGCLLRAICETHETPLLGHGMVGEILELFLT